MNSPACTTPRARIGRELLIEIIASKNGPVDDDTIARVIARLYGIGIKPDWWKLEGQATGAAWNRISAAIEVGDPLCRGIMLLGLEAPEEDLAGAFQTARGCKHVKGFAVGTHDIRGARLGVVRAARSATTRRFAGMADAFARLCALWREYRRSPPLPLFAGEGWGEGGANSHDPHPPLRATFSREGREKGSQLRGSP